MDENCDGVDGNAKSTLSGGDSRNINEIIEKVGNYIAGFAGSIAFVMFVAGGIMFMTASGSDEKIRKAKKTMISAGIGLAIAVLAYTFVGTLVNSILI